MDHSWYVLSQVALLAGLPDSVPAPSSRLVGQAILPLEITERRYRLEYAIATNDLPMFIQRLPAWIDAATSLKSVHAIAETVGFPEWPRGELPVPGPEATADIPKIVSAAVTAFSVVAAPCGPAGLASLRDAVVVAGFGSEPGRVDPSGVVRDPNPGSTGNRTVEQCVAAWATESLTPSELLEATLRLTLHVQAGDYRRVTERPFARRAKKLWRRVATEQRFALRAPAVTVPAIEEAAAREGDSLADVASLILAALPAVAIQVPSELLAQLRALVGEGEHPRRGVGACFPLQPGNVSTAPLQ